MRKVFSHLTSISLFALYANPPAYSADTWALDTAKSRANFNVRHMMIANVKGGFTSLNGKVQFDGKDVKSAAVEATINANSIDTQSEGRDTHLKSADFLDVSKYPFIKFVSTKILPSDSGFDIAGELTIHGTSKQVVVHADKLGEITKSADGNSHISAHATAKINRKDFGMTFNKRLDNGGALVGDDVAVELNVELVQAAN